jgi:hypothetical protein
MEIGAWLKDLHGCSSFDYGKGISCFQLKEAACDERLLL